MRGGIRDLVGLATVINQTVNLIEPSASRLTQDRIRSAETPHCGAAERGLPLELRKGHHSVTGWRVGWVIASLWSVGVPELFG